MEPSRELYDLQSVRAMLRAAGLCLGYAAVFLRGTDDELYNELKKVLRLVDELLYRVESKLGTYLPAPTGEGVVSSARRIVEEVVLRG